jgi:hypothetical protein
MLIEVSQTELEELLNKHPNLKLVIKSRPEQIYSLILIKDKNKSINIIRRPIVLRA